MTARVLLHVGYHKTATSFLQQRFFAPENGFIRWPERLPDVNQMFVSLGPFGSVTEEVVREAQSAMDQADAEGKVLVLSHERLSGHPSSGGFDAELLLGRLASLFPHAKVLVTIREQISMIHSSYGQYVREGGTLSLESYLEPLQPELHRVPGFDPRFFEYSHLITAYQDRFGKDAVAVLPYEQFKETPADFLSEIARHVDADVAFGDVGSRSGEVVNRGDGPSALRLIRLLNGPVLRSQFSPSGLTGDHRTRLGAIKVSRSATSPFAKVLDARLREREIDLITQSVGDRYALDNAAVAALTGLDLAAYGYPVAN